MGKRASLVVIFAAGVCATAPLASCLDATEIVLELSTDVSCATVQGTDVIAPTKVHIRIGSPKNIDGNPPTKIESTACTPGDATASAWNDLGNVVVVPSGGFDDAVAISVALSNDSATPTSACFPEGPNAPLSCIYAHRQISFLPHNRVTLPIVLSSVCAGVSCVAPETCDPTTGKCGNGTIDPNDCGTNCTTGEDAGGKPDVIMTIDSPTFDVPVFDSPITDGGCPLTQVKCGSVCVDLQTNKQNCGGCGLDCSGGTCSAGICIVNASIVGTCLAVVSGTVYVATSVGVFKVPSAGGNAAILGTQADQILAMAGTATDVAWIGSNGNVSYVYDLGTGTTYSDSTQTAQTQLMALNASAASWFDDKAHGFFYQNLSSSSPISYATIIATNPVWVTMSKQYIYASIPQTGLFYMDGTTTTPVTATAPGPILSDAPDSTTPNVYEVEKGVDVFKRDYKLANPKLFATSGTQITSLAWDGTSLFANATTAISMAQNSTFIKLAVATPAPKCIAVDSDAVYWLDATKGLFKVYKP